MYTGIYACYDFFIVFYKYYKHLKHIFKKVLPLQTHAVSSFSFILKTETIQDNPGRFTSSRQIKYPPSHNIIKIRCKLFNYNRCRLQNYQCPHWSETHPVTDMGHCWAIEI